MIQSATRQFQNLPPLSLYIHIPWCIRKCPYCDFNSHASPEQLPESEYVDALIRDLDAELPAIWGRRLHSIFIGGGTPSLFSAHQLDRLLSHIRAVLPGSPTMEITLEANPGTFEQKKFSDFRKIGINRLSVGIQSFNDTQLKTLGRVHTAAEARRAIDMIDKAGFDNFNLDLIYALPGQSVESALKDLQTAIDFAPTHLSHYQLTIEPNTLFHARPPSHLPDNDLTFEIQDQCQAMLSDSHYLQYEVSAYAREQKASQHNMNYWLFGDYIGIGAGAHGKISRADTGDVVRYSKLKQPKAYMQHAGSPEARQTVQPIEYRQMGFEFMLNALRLKAGFDATLYQQHTGQPLTSIEKILEEARQRGLLEYSADWIQPTKQGYLFLNDLQELFLQDE